jgi:hypothetical protein
LHLIQLIIGNINAFPDSNDKVSSEFFPPSLAAGLMLNFHVQIKRALRSVGLITAEVWALVCLLYLVVTAAKVSLAATWIEVVLI